MSEADAANEPAPESTTERDEWQVILRDGDPTALVRTPDEVVDNVPLLTLKPEESAEDALEGVDHDVVLLQQGRDTAHVRVKSHENPDVPLYKERAENGGEEPREVRVRVREIREHPPKDKTKNPLSRLFRK